jgi:hypothetical protein
VESEDAVGTVDDVDFAGVAGGGDAIAAVEVADEGDVVCNGFGRYGGITRLSAVIRRDPNPPLDVELDARELVGLTGTAWDGSEAGPADVGESCVA